MEKPLRICILQTNLPSERVKSGGEERFTLALAQSLSARHEVIVITSGTEEKTVTRGRLTIRYVKSTNLCFLRFFAYTRRLVRELGKLGGIDIIQCNISDRSKGIGRTNCLVVPSLLGHTSMRATLLAFDKGAYVNFWANPSRKPVRG